MMRWIWMLGLSWLVGCGTFGRTRPVSVGLPTVAPVGVGQVDFDPRQADMQGVGTFEFGEFNEQDRASLERSLDRVLSGSEGGLQAHVYVRSHVIVASNNAGSALACVAWALTEPDGAVVFEEQVYVGSEGHLIVTLGHLKERVHEGLVARIAGVAGVLATGGTAADFPEMPEGVSHDPQEAARGLPVMLQSHYVFTLGGYLYSGHSATRTVDYGANAQTERFDWVGYLGGLAADR